MTTAILLLDSDKKGSVLWLRTVRGVNPQVDGDGRYPFVGSGDTIGLSLDLLAYLVEVCELLPFAVKEFSPFWKDDNEVHVRLVVAALHLYERKTMPVREWKKQL